MFKTKVKFQLLIIKMKKQLFILVEVLTKKKKKIVTLITEISPH